MIFCSIRGLVPCELVYSSLIELLSAGKKRVNQKLFLADISNKDCVIFAALQQQEVCHEHTYHGYEQFGGPA